MLMGMGVVFAFGKPKDIQDLGGPKLQGWEESLKPRNVYYSGDADAKPDTRVSVGKPFTEIVKKGITEGENLGETVLSQGPFGVKAG